MILERFAAPGNLTELSDDDLRSWSEVLSTIFDEAAEDFPQFYNPTQVDTPPDHAAHVVRWRAFPGLILAAATSQEGRWAAADESRDVQDEYCEWSVSRDTDGNVVRVTFTSETPQYYDHLLQVQEPLLIELYEGATGQQVSANDLRRGDGSYNPRNELNMSTAGPIVHLAQQNNALGAAVRLAAQATVLRERDGQRVTDQQDLVRCGRLGEHLRHSDPQIAAAVNNLVARLFDVTLADPPGLYLDGLETAGMQTPDDADAAEFWHVERGDEDHVVRARFEVPEGRGYQVSDLFMDGRPIQFGAQLADRVQVRLTAIAKPGTSVPRTEPCR